MFSDQQIWFFLMLAASSYPILSPPPPGPFPILHFRTPHPLATLSLSITLSTPSIMFFPLIVSFITVLEPYTRFITHDISFFPSCLYPFTFAVLGIIHHDIFSSMAISLFIIQPLFLFVWVLCNPLLHDWALCSLLFYWELCIPLPVIGNYASHYLLLGTMHPAIYFWVLCDRLLYYIRSEEHTSELQSPC